MSRSPRRTLILIAGAVVILGSALFFPRLLAFFELAARELRYLWWLVLLLALGIWLAFFYNRSAK